MGPAGLGVRDELQRLGEQLEAMKNAKEPAMETISDKMQAAKGVIEQAVKDFKRIN